MTIDSSKNLWTLEELRALFGESVRVSGELLITGVSIDSRLLSKGDLFFALKGPKNDGHEHVQKALEAGASAVVVDHIPPELSEREEAPILLVPETLEALRTLGAAARLRSSARVMALTGSYGKTGSKEALRHVLKAQGETFATERSHNNHWGVPYTLSRFPKTADYGVFEVGTNNPGEIVPLAGLIQPEVALITNVHEMHAKNFESVHEIVKEKASLFSTLRAGGTGILNRDSPHFEALQQEAEKAGVYSLLTFGTHADADVRVLEANLTRDGLCITLQSAGRLHTITLPLFHRHWAMNAAGVIAAVRAMGASVEAAMESLRDFTLPQGRGNIHWIPYKGGKICVIDESYNAGPESMKRALQLLGEIPNPHASGRRIAVLGDMGELTQAQAMHESLNDLIVDVGLDRVFTSGEMMGHLHEKLSPTHKGANEPDPDKLAAMVAAEVKPGDIVMVKGSRGRYYTHGRMYSVVTALQALSS